MGAGPDRAAVAVLIEDLRSLAALRLKSKSDLDAWSARAELLTERLKHDPQLDGLEIEDQIWLWLGDACARLKDAEYAGMQNRGFEESLAVLQTRYAI